MVTMVIMWHGIKIESDTPSKLFSFHPFSLHHKHQYKLIEIVLISIAVPHKGLCNLAY